MELINQTRRRSNVNKPRLAYFWFCRHLPRFVTVFTWLKTSLQWRKNKTKVNISRENKGFLGFVFRRYKWSKVKFCWRDNLSRCKFFLWKEGWLSQTWECGNNSPASKTHFCWMILLKTATNSSNNDYFRPNLTWHVMWLVRSTKSILKCSWREKLTVC